MDASALRARLEGSRRSLVEAVQGLTERDFATEVDGTSIAAQLAVLAPAEREAVRGARQALGIPQRPLPPATERERVSPPQLVHDLAGARYETLLLLQTLDDEALSADVGGMAVGTRLQAVAEREEAAARDIAARRSANPR